MLGMFAIAVLVMWQPLRYSCKSCLHSEVTAFTVLRR